MSLPKGEYLRASTKDIKRMSRVQGWDRSGVRSPATQTGNTGREHLRASILEDGNGNPVRVELAPARLPA